MDFIKDRPEAMGAATALFLVLKYMAGSIGILFAATLIAMIFDYGTGMVKAFKHKELDSEVGLWGLVKKFGYFALMALACLFDLIIIDVGHKIGFEIPINCPFATLVTAWAFANEGISILENLAGIGVPVPKFLLVGLNRFKDKTEEKGKIEEE